MNLQTINASASPEVQINENFIAVSPAGLFARKAPTTAGLTWGYYGGIFPGTFAVIADGTLTLTNTATNYIECDNAGTLFQNTSAFTAGRNRLYSVVCAGGMQTSYTDYRTAIGVNVPTLAGDNIFTGSNTFTDSLIRLASGNAANTIDIGMYGVYQPAATPLYSGLFRDATDGVFKLFDSLQVEPTTTVNVAGAGYASAALTVGALNASTAAFSGLITANAGISIPTGQSVTGVGTAAISGFASVSATALAGALDGSVGGVTPAAGAFTTLTSSNIAALTTAAESWIGPSSTTGVYFKNGFVGIGTPTPASPFDVFSSTQTAIIDITGSGQGATFRATRYSDNTIASFQSQRKARGTALSPAIVQSGDNVGNLAFVGYDGSAFITLANIKGVVDGTPGASDMPGRLEFSTTADGTSVVSERMRITSGGLVGIGTIPKNMLEVGSETAGGNVLINGTLGAELAPALTGASGVNWTFGAEYTTPLAGTIDKVADGTNTITPTAATTIVAGTTYRVVVVVDSVSVASGATYTLGGVAGTPLTAPGTYTDYITAITTGKLIITPTPTTTRFTISSVSVKAVTAGTGDLTVRGDLFASLLRNPSAPANYGLRISSIGEVQVLINGVAYGFDQWGGLRSGAISATNNVTASTYSQATPIDGLVLRNLSVANAGVPVQAAQRIRFSGTVWDTGATASRTVNFKNEVLPISGNPGTARMLWGYDYNGGGYSELMSLTSNGTVSVSGSLSTSDATDATSATAAALTSAGGIASVKGLWIGQTSRLVGAVTMDNVLAITEMTAPTGAANKASIYAEDNGGGKTKLMCKLGDDVAIQIAIQA